MPGAMRLVNLWLARLTMSHWKRAEHRFGPGPRLIFHSGVWT